MCVHVRTASLSTHNLCFGSKIKIKTEHPIYIKLGFKGMDMFPGGIDSLSAVNIAFSTRIRNIVSGFQTSFWT